MLSTQEQSDSLSLEVGEILDISNVGQTCTVSLPELKSSPLELKRHLNAELLCTF